METAPWLLLDPAPGVNAPAPGRVVLDSSCAGLTRASIFFARSLSEGRLAPTAVGIVGLFWAASDSLLDRSRIRPPRAISPPPSSYRRGKRNPACPAACGS